MAGKTFWTLRNDLNNLHNEIAMKDVKPQDEDKLDEVCEYLSKALQLLNHLDTGS